jgi:hypothetical protein
MGLNIRMNSSACGLTPSVDRPAPAVTVDVHPAVPLKRRCEQPIDVRHFRDVGLDGYRGPSQWCNRGDRFLRRSFTRGVVDHDTGTQRAESLGDRLADVARPARRSSDEFRVDAGREEPRPISCVNQGIATGGSRLGACGVQAVLTKSTVELGARQTEALRGF